ncbi:hypothetical protein C8F04DRAFT_658569 [Mycena alexandri]|uniref:AAA+ ATPase domain-containing protein n=1 Tax=Mycena alexandri TaxID=1745969 RepID=A0AAD6X1K6_9AGAR|nr:hypothetical protein C8F04DRAFT_658569 [Mycena alexandri]
MSKMSSTNRGKGDSVLKYATIAASTLRDIADSSPVPFLRTIAAVSLSILAIAQSLKSNQEESIRLVSRIDQLLSVILQLCVKGDVLSPATLHNIGKFADTLQKIHSFVRSQQNKTVLKRLFRQSENTALLEECNSGLRDALDVFEVESSLVATTEMADMRERAEERHKELVYLFRSESEVHEIIDSDTASLVSRSLFELGNSTTSLVLLPPTPKIFHGRESELNELVDLLLQSPARVMILGPGGIGKTSLATTALHHPKIAERYTHRHFVSCESAASHDDLVAIIASHIEVSSPRNLSKRVVRHFSGGPPTILLLDNLETCWEPLGTRSQVEDFLSLLTDISHLALMITMRGAERPGSVRWTRPFLPPLEPLSDDAARRTFADITDEHLDDADIRELLVFTNNVPLAVNLVANIAAFEGHDNVLSRWKEEKTALFSEGPDKRSNLDLSIRISLSSPRMLEAPGAHSLLRLLSLLPDGISDADLLQSAFPVIGMGRSKTTLIRTSLAYLDHDKRLRVLAPIREYIKKYDPPPPSLCRPLRQHFHGLIALWKDYQHLSTAGITQRIAANIGNLYAVLTHGLDWNEPDLAETLQSIIRFDSFSRVSARGSSGMLELVPEYLDRLGNHRLRAAYMIEFVNTWQYHSLPDLDHLEETTIQHFRDTQDKSGEAKFLCAIAGYFRQHDNNIPKALRYYETAINLAKQVDDIRTQCAALRNSADCIWQLGKYREARAKSRAMRRLAQDHGLFFLEAHAIRVELLCRVSLGDLASCVALSAEGRALLAFCGLQGSTLDLTLVNSDAEVHLQKTEYAEARALYSRTYADQAPLAQAYDRLNLVCIDNETGVETAKVRRDLETVKASFESIMNPPGITFCEVFSACVDIRDGILHRARLSLEGAFSQTRGHDQEISITCLNKLGDIACGLYDAWTTLGWALVLLAFALNGRNSIAVHHALRCLADVFLAQGDEETALNLLNVALAGFTTIDIHRSRGECLLRIGDIFYRQGKREKAVEFWRKARPLFVCSLQTQEVAHVDERLQGYPQ